MNGSTAVPRGPKKHRLLGGLALAGLLLAATRLALLQGLLAPVRIEGPSMAAALCGRHHRVVCEDCGFPFRCDADRPPGDGCAVCPNCGYPGNTLRNSQKHPGQRVLIDRFPFPHRRPKRWDVVAFRDQHGQLSVKRLVALPGEHVAIRNGDLLINGAICRKSLACQRQLAIPVHDDRYLPDRNRALPARWRSDRLPSGWSALEEGYRFSMGAESRSLDREQPSPSAFDWLTYRHWRCYANPADRTEESPVTDNDAYNQGHSRELQLVTDLILSCQLEMRAGAQVAVLAHDGREVFYVYLDPQRRDVAVYRGRDCIAVRHAPGLMRNRPLLLEVGLFDQQIVVAVNRSVVTQTPYLPRIAPLAPTSRPFGLGAAGGPVLVRDLRIFRDIFYLGPSPLGQHWQLEHPLGDNEYLLLGDNQPVSVDSRNWARPGLPGGQLLGRVLWPARPPGA